MTARHTPEPWKLIELDGELYINPDRPTGEYALIAKATGMHCGEERAEVKRACFARIVACVNALAGVEDPAAFVQLAELDRERVGALIEASRDAVLSHCHTETCDLPQWVDDLEDALDNLTDADLLERDEAEAGG